MRLRIRDVRKERGLTLRDLACKVAMSESYVSEIETGKKEVNGRRLEQFARALGVAVTDLIASADADPVLTDHMKIFASLSEDDKAAVQRHAESLLALRSRSE